MEGHRHFAVSFGAAALTFAAAYWLLERFRRGRRRRTLGALHVGLTCLGVALIFAPTLALSTGRFPVDPASFAAWNAVVSAGYLIVLVGQGFFVAVLLDAFRREPDMR